MAFSLFFKTKEQKEALAGIERLCINDYKKNKKIDLKKVQSELDKLDFSPSQRDKKKFFMNFITEFDGKRLPNNCVDYFNKLAETLSVRNMGTVKKILDNLEHEKERVKRRHEIMTMKKLPVIDVDVILKKQEEAYFDTYVTFYEERTRRVYQGGSAGTSIRVAKGMSFRVGKSKGNAVSEDYLKEIDTGEFIITNKRIVFVGGNKSWNIALPKLLRIQEITVNNQPSLAFSTETASKKKMVSFNNEDDRFEAEVMLKRVVKGDDEILETKDGKEGEDDFLVLGTDSMEDEMLD